MSFWPIQLGRGTLIRNIRLKFWYREQCFNALASKHLMVMHVSDIKKKVSLDWYDWFDMVVMSERNTFDVFCMKFVWVYSFHLDAWSNEGKKTTAFGRVETAGW